MNVACQLLISNMLVALLIALLAVFVGLSGRQARLAHWVWLTVFLKLITPPLVLIPVAIPQQTVGNVHRATSFFHASLTDLPHSADLISESAQLAPATAAQITETPRPHFGLRRMSAAIPRIVLAAWLCGSITLIVRGIWRYTRFSRLLHNEGRVDLQADQYVRQLLRRTSGEFVPSVRRISAKISPMLFGVGRATTIVCPEALWASLNESGRHAFLAHEIAHYQRRDHWVRWLEWIVTAIYWWLPLIYLARQQLERHEEAACDAWALKHSSTSRRVYAETLLSVVDFLSESKARWPRLASRMQPTTSLEERLRLIMQPQAADAGLPRLNLCVVACSISLLLAHPQLRPYAAQLTPQQQPTGKPMVTAESLERNPGKPISEQSSEDLNEAPSAANAWWNSMPSPTWADQKLGDKDLHLQAKVGNGIGITIPGGSTYYFDSADVRALAYIAASNRLIVGNASGELHLWDADAHASVSLIGKHKSAITSVCYSTRNGLVSGDCNGMVNVWDIHSGQLLDTKFFDGSIACLRWSRQSDALAVLVGGWSSDSSTPQLHVLPLAALRTTVGTSSSSQAVVEFGAISSPLGDRPNVLSVPHATAVIDYNAELGWLALDWSGIVWSLSTGKPIVRLEKNAVSGIALCSDLMPVFTLRADPSELSSEATEPSDLDSYLSRSLPSEAKLP